MSDTRPQAVQVPERLASWAILCLVATAVALALALAFSWWPLALGAGSVGFLGVAFLALVSSRGGQEAPQH